MDMETLEDLVIERMPSLGASTAKELFEQIDEVDDYHMLVNAVLALKHKNKITKEGDKYLVVSNKMDASVALPKQSARDALKDALAHFPDGAVVLDIADKMEVSKPTAKTRIRLALVAGEIIKVRRGVYALPKSSNQWDKVLAQRPSGELTTPEVYAITHAIDVAIEKHLASDVTYQRLVRARQALEAPL